MQITRSLASCRQFRRSAMETLWAKRSQRIWRSGNRRGRNHFNVWTSRRSFSLYSDLLLILLHLAWPIPLRNLTRMHGYITFFFFFFLLACVYTQCASSTKICHRGSSRSNRYVLLMLSLLIRVSFGEDWVASTKYRELISLNVFRNRTRLNNRGSDIFRRTSRIDKCTDMTCFSQSFWNDFRFVQKYSGTVEQNVVTKKKSALLHVDKRLQLSTFFDMINWRVKSRNGSLRN